MNQEIDISHISSVLDTFSSLKVLVAGDIILDVYLWGTVNRISPEAPVPIVDIKRESSHLGGAANVAHNVSSLGGKVLLMGRIGNDAAGGTVLNLLENNNIDHRGVVVSQDCPTTVKTRIVAHSQQVVRFDRELRKNLSDPDLRKIASVSAALEEVDIIVVSDYAKGFIETNSMVILKELSYKTGKPLLVDPKVSNKLLYKEVTVLVPNSMEAAQLAGMIEEDDDTIGDISQKILKELQCDYLLITRGPKGMSLFSEGAIPQHIPTFARKVFDVTGAGDTVMATLALGMGAGLSVFEAAYLANIAAGYVVGELGTAAIGLEQLKHLLQKI